jgi:hypothetical protein
LVAKYQPIARFAEALETMWAPLVGREDFGQIIAGGAAAVQGLGSAMASAAVEAARIQADAAIKVEQIRADAAREAAREAREAAREAREHNKPETKAG